MTIHYGLKITSFSFNGRVPRLPFWVVKLTLLGWGSTFQYLMGSYGPEKPMTAGPAFITLLNFTIVLWIALAVQIKRWHDRDKSGWWVLLNVIPVIGQIWTLIECGFLRGTMGDNRFGQQSTVSLNIDNRKKGEKHESR